MIIEKEGNIFDSLANAISQGVNIRGLMGAGLAKEFRSRRPNMYADYKIACDLGELQAGSFHRYFDVASGQWIYNIASQDDPGPNARYTWLVEGLRATLNDLRNQGLRSLAVPQIGCGIGGLEWGTVRWLIGLLADDYPEITIELWTYKN